MNSFPDNKRVIDIIEAAAVDEIMPRFQHLSGDDIREKGPGDLVTIADLNAERYLSEHLLELVPGSCVVGEENADADPDVIKQIQGDAPVWIIDPVDGTGNFSRGQAPFVVIVAYVEGGVTKTGWIHDPITGETIHAELGKGAWSGDRRLTLPAPPPIEEMVGSLSP
ncbi:MAG: inositol monophosphatase, partial [Rhodospirillaceae bacterium]|nr:inositol monophosphatase [Rhodospirillaceae bacterium]